MWNLINYKKESYMEKKNKIVWHSAVVFTTIWGLISFIIWIKDLHTQNLGLKYWIKNLNILQLGQVMQIIGIIILVSALLIFIFLLIFKRYQPQRGLVDIVAPLLLSKDVIGDTEAKFNKRVDNYIIVRIGVIIVIIGIVTSLVLKIFG